MAGISSVLQSNRAVTKTEVLLWEMPAWWCEGAGQTEPIASDAALATDDDPRAAPADDPILRTAHDKLYTGREKAIQVLEDKLLLLLRRRVGHVERVSFGFFHLVHPRLISGNCTTIGNR